METWQDEDPRKAMANVFADWKQAAKEAEKENTGSIARAFQLDTRIEQAPNPNSRITIGPEKDELGVPSANLHWELTALDKKSIRKIYQLIGKQAGIAGIGRVNLMEFLRDENDNSWPEGVNGG